MKDASRAALAYIAGRLISGRRSSSLFDYSRSKYVDFSGTIRSRSVHVFNYDVRGYITGSGTDTNLDLFDYHRGAHVNLKLANDGFSGFDYGTGTHFKGTVRNNRVNIFDYGEGKYYDYSLT